MAVWNPNDSTGVYLTQNSYLPGMFWVALGGGRRAFKNSVPTII